MTISVTDYAIHMAIINPQGRLDALSAPTMRDQFNKLFCEGTTHFVIDLSNTQYLDSAGLAVFVSLLKRVRKVGGDVKLTQPKQASVQRTLSLTRFDHIFEVADSVEAAVARFQLSLPPMADKPLQDQSVESSFYVVPNSLVYVA